MAVLSRCVDTTPVVSDVWGSMTPSWHLQERVELTGLRAQWQDGLLTISLNPSAFRMRT